MAGFKEFAHEIRKRATDYPLATAQHVAMYAKDNNRVYIIDENGNLVDFEVNDVYFNDVYVYGNVSISGNTTHYGWVSSPGVSGVENESFGFEAMHSNHSGGANVAVGYKSMYSNINGGGNVAVGFRSMYENISGFLNVAVGFGALSENIFGSGNVALGTQAGSWEMGSNKLYIANSAGTSADALIYGEFDNGEVYVNGNLTITDKLTVGGLIDPTGLQLTPVASNPGDVNTIWVNSTDSLLYFGGNPISGGSGGSVYTGGNISIPLAPSMGSTQTNITPGQIQLLHVGPYSDSSTWTKEGISFTQGSPSGVSTTLGKTSLSVSSTPNGTTTINDGTVTTKGVILTPTAANPGGATTTWVNSADNLLYFGTSLIISGGGGGGGDVIGSQDNNFTGVNTFTGTITSPKNDAIYTEGFGLNALSANTSAGVFNTAFGNSALMSNTTGQNNTAVGTIALRDNVDTHFNTAIGAYTLVTNTGSINTAVGAGALNLNTTGTQNSSMGYDSLQHNQTGNANVAMGAYALWELTAGDGNVAIGYSALQNNLTGTGNVAIGRTAGAQEFGSNKLYIENSPGTSGEALIYGEFDTGRLYTKGKEIATRELRVKSMPTNGGILDLDNYDVFVWDALTGPRSAILPDIHLYSGRIIYLKNATGGLPLSVTITCTGIQTFDNAATSLVLSNWDYTTLLAHNRWYKMA